MGSGLEDIIYQLCARRFHEEGLKRFPRHWRRYCRALVKRGADVELAKLMVGTTNGWRTVPVLFHDKALLEELMAKKTRRDQTMMLKRLARGKETVQ